MASESALRLSRMHYTRTAPDAPTPGSCTQMTGAHACSLNVRARPSRRLSWRTKGRPRAKWCSCLRCWRHLALTVIRSDVFACAPAASVTLTVKANVPFAVGVPVMEIGGDDERLRPGGRWPREIDAERPDPTGEEEVLQVQQANALRTDAVEQFSRIDPDGA